MKITVRTDRGQITLEVAVTDRVEELKAKISDRVGCPVDQQQLSFENVILEDLKYLLDYSLGPECVLLLEVQIKIIVKMCNTQLELQCYPCMNITEIKHEISKKIPIQPNNQVLTYEDRELKNTQTVKDCKFKGDACIILTGIIQVSVTLSSGKNICLLLEQSSHVFAIKEEIQRKECIPSALLTLNYKGRVLREDQTFASIHYREGESISLVVQQSDCDKMNIFVKKPNGQKQLISINNYDPIGKIEDTVFSDDNDSLFSHFCLYNDKKLDDMDVLNMHRIQPMSQVELRSIENRISVFVSLLNGSVTSFYIQPMELVLAVKSRIKSKLGTDNAHKNLFYKHRKLANEQTIRECEISQGAHLLFGSEESFSVTIHPDFKSFEILAQKNDKIKDLKCRIQNKENIPIDFQILNFEGRELQDARFVNKFTIQCGSIISLAIRSDLGIPISLKLVDLVGNFKYISGVGVYITVENFLQNLSNIFPINKQDSLAFQGIIMEPARLLCSYEIPNDSQVQIISIYNPGILGHTPTGRHLPDNATQTPLGQTTVAHGYMYPQSPKQHHQHPSQNPQQPIPTYHQHIQNAQQPTDAQQPLHTHYQQNSPPAKPSQPLHNPQPNQYTVQNPRPIPNPQPIQDPQPVPNQYTVHNPHDVYNQQPIQNPQPIQDPQPIQNPQPVPNPDATLSPQHSHYAYRQDEQDSRVVDRHLEQSDSIPASRTQQHMGRQQSAPRSPAAKEIVMLVMHPIAGTFQIQCTSNQTIFDLKERISQEINIPRGKIQLLYDDQLLSQDTATLGEYGIYKDRIIKLNDLLCIHINFGSKKFIKWMNGCDLVSSLATELAESISVQQDQENIQLRDILDILVLSKNAIKTLGRRVSKYQYRAPLTEELETLKSIIEQETEVTTSDGTILLSLNLPKHNGNEIAHKITFILSNEYPHSSPTILLDQSPPPPELDDHLTALSGTLQGTPAIYPLYEAVSDWMLRSGNAGIIRTGQDKEDTPDFDKFEVIDESSESGNVIQPLFESLVKGIEQESQSKEYSADTFVAERGGKGKSKSDKKKERNMEQLNAGSQKQPRDSDGGCTKKDPMKSATDVIHRIIWDPDLPSESFTIGYLDRFVGIIERPFSEFSWEDLASADMDVLAIPKHRIQYFKYKSVVVWDKNIQIDKVYGSRGTKTTIMEVIEEYEASNPRSKPVEPVPDTTEQPPEHDVITDPAAIAELMLMDSDEDTEGDVISGASGSRLGNRKYRNKDRPNYFICFKVTDACIRHQAKCLQDGIVSNCPMLSEACLPINRLHVTLVMVRIDTEEDMCRAIEVIGNFQSQLVRILPQFNKIEISGVDCFRDQVIFAGIKANSALTRVASALKIQFEEAGVGTPGNHLPFKPHMTLIKLSRPIAKKMNITRINYTFYQEFRGMQFGFQPVENIILGSMFELNEEDGFYVSKFVVANQISCLRQDLSEVLLAQILKNICVTNRPLPIVQLIEESMKSEINTDTFLSIVMQNATPEHQGRDVIILRGLPGSGKSTLIENSPEKKQDLLALCSADSFFTDSLSGEYRFDIEKLSSAHKACLNLFIDNLIANKSLVVVDNTNSQYWEYSLYKCFAKCFGYKYHILELTCPSEDVLKVYHQRNKHNVAYETTVAMRNRWESDKDSIVIDPRKLGSSSLMSLVRNNKVKVKSKQEPSRISTVRFVAVFLSQNARNTILTQFPTIYGNLKATHINLQYMPTQAQLNAYCLGAKLDFIVLGCVQDDKVQAAPIRLETAVACDNAHPHITISVSPIGSARDSNSLLSRAARADNLNTLPNKPSDMLLTGTLGIQVELTDGTVRRVFSSSELEALNTPKPPKPPSPSIDIYTGPCDLITQLFIFDLDGTLVNTPGPLEGPEQYERLTGVPWPHNKWVVYPESLTYPMSTLCTPGPALFQFLSHQSRAQSMTVVMTGRLESIGSAVSEVLHNFGIRPDLLLCKEDSSPLHTPEYKALQLRRLLAQFPGVLYVKVWEDLAENIASFAAITVDYLDKEFELIDVTSSQQQTHKKKPTHSAKKSKVFQTVRVYGKMQRSSYSEAVESTINLISSLWASCIGHQGAPEQLVHTFGSYPLKRMSDIDLCLLAPDRLSHEECIGKMEQLLIQCGINSLHVSPHSRVPRIRFLCRYTGTADISYDVIFLRLRGMGEGVPCKVKEFKKLINSGDCPSVTALEGLEFVNKVKQTLIKGIPEEEFAAAIELIVLILRSKHHKGNAYHCTRTFHVLKILLSLLEEKRVPRSVLSSADQLTRALLEQLGRLSAEEWAGYLGEFVPIQYIPRLQEIFTECFEISNSPSFPSVALYLKMLTPVAFPLPNHVAMEIEIECPSPSLQFKYETIVEAKLGSVVRRMLESGINLVPGPCSSKRICFSIPDNPGEIEKTHFSIKQFLAEFDNSRHEVTISFISQSTVVFDTDQTGLETIFGQIIEFKSTDIPSLSLPTTLTSHQRLLVYQFLEKQGMRHATCIEGSLKRIVVKKN